MKLRAPTNAESEAINLIKLRVDPSGLRQERWRMQDGWYKNMCYFSGQQHFYLDNGRIIDAITEIPEHRVLYKVNLTRMAVNRAAAKVLNVNAKFVAVPQSGSARHKNIAETSEKLFNHIRAVTGWNDTKSMLGTMWAAICGSAFYRVVWDPLAGEPERFYLDAETKRPVPTAMLTSEDVRTKERLLEFEDFASGEVRIDVDSPFAIHHDWSSRDDGVKGCQYMASRTFVDREIIAERWGVDPDDLTAEDTSAGITNYEEAIAFMANSMGMSPLNWSLPADKRGNRCILVDYWERPSARFKKGRRIVYGGQRVLHDGPNPYAGDRSGLLHLPWVKQDWAPHPGRFWGSSLVEDLTNPQHAVNDARSALLEFLRVFGRPPTYVWSNSGIDPTQMTIDPGGVYVISAMSKPPVFGGTPNLPTDVTNIGQLCQGDLNMIASQSDIDGSKLPSQLRSGDALRQMGEERDIALNVTTKLAVNATCDVGKMGLGLYQLFADKPRVLRYLTDNREFGFTDFTGADLSNDLIVLGEPSIMDTRASQLAELRDDIQVGAIDPVNNPEDRLLWIAARHYHTSDQAVQRKLANMKRQESETRRMILNPLQYGEVGYPVMPWEKHEEHIGVMEDFFLTEEFDALPPETQAVLTMHWQAHMEFLQMQVAQEQQALQAQKGAPGEKGKASQPKQPSAANK